MTRAVIAIPPETRVEDAAGYMKVNGIGLLVVGSKDDLSGVITDRDITVRVTADGLDPKKTKVSEVMTANPFHTFDDEDIEDAALYMEDKRVRRLLVLNRSRELVGVLSLDDVAVKGRKTNLSGYVLSKIARK
jgi:CBS domain-containing protein